MKGRMLIVALTLMLAWCHAFSQKMQKGILYQNVNYSNLFVQHTDTSYYSTLVVNNKDYNRFFCNYVPINNYITAIDSSIIVHICDNEGITYEHFPNYTIVHIDKNNKLKKEYDIKKVMYHKDTTRIDTIRNVFSKDIAKFANSEIDTIMLKCRCIENAYLQSKFGNNKDSVVVKIIVPEYLATEDHNGFYELKLYKQPNGKIKMISSYGNVEYPEGFVVKNTKTYNRLGFQGYRKMQIRYGNQKFTYKHKSYSCDKIANFMIDEFKPPKDSIWLKSLYPYYIEIAGHHYLLSNDDLKKDKSNLDILMFCEYIRYINYSKRNCWKFIKQSYN